uniref:Uncharacterized protein n=1 Tax=Oryza brachyantha TaxID=4533 RepID=J3LB42_ORYBR
FRNGSPTVIFQQTILSSPNYLPGRQMHEGSHGDMELQSLSANHILRKYSCCWYLQPFLHYLLAWS